MEQEQSAEQQPAVVKKPWQSKTVWAGIISAVAVFIPQVNHFITANPDAYAMAVSALFVGLRIITHGKIEIK